MEKEKKGFFAIGYVINGRGFADIIKSFSKGGYYDYAEFDSMVDDAWNNRTESLICFDIDGNKVENTSDCIAKIWILLNWKEKNIEDEIYAQFKTQTPGSIDTSSWTGVDIGRREELSDSHVIERTEGLEKASYISNFESVNRNLCEITGRNFSTADCKQILNEAYICAKMKGELAIVEDNGSTKTPIAVFCLEGISSTRNQPVYVKMETNINKGTTTPWYGAFIVDKDSLKDEILDYRLFHGGYFVFDNMQDQNTFLQKLSDKAMRENWQWSTSTPDTYPILKSYLEYTYYRLLDEDLVAPDDKKKIFEYQGKQYFNSGLLDRNFRQIIIIGDKYNYEEEFPGIGKLEWNLLKNLRSCSQNERDIASMFEEGELPKVATYFKECKEVVFDASLRIVLNDNHIFEDGVSRGRLQKYQADYNAHKDIPDEKELLIARIARDFDSAVARAKLMAERNYKLAVPQFWKETGEIQFLLPIYLGEKEEAEKPQCALVLNLEKDARRPYYRGATILTLDQAYNNTRLIAKPDVFWLNDLVQG